MRHHGGELAIWADSPQQALVHIGDIAVTRDWVHTSSGTAPLDEVHWSHRDFTRTTSRIPVWAIVLAVVFFPFGLVFLLAREEVTMGSVQVVVQARDFVHGATFMVDQRQQIVDVDARLHYAQVLTENARRQAHGPRSASLPPDLR